VCAGFCPVIDFDGEDAFDDLPGSGLSPFDTQTCQEVTNVKGRVD